MTRIYHKLTGKIIMVTGSTAGIGKGTAQELARRGAGVLLVGTFVEQLTGSYFAKKKATPSHPSTYDEVDAQRLWDISASWFEGRKIYYV